MKLYDMISELKVALILLGPITAIAIILAVCTALSLFAVVL
jgi:hypothetical protein